VAGLATHLAGVVVAVAAATVTASQATTKSSITAASHGTATASATMKSGIRTDMLVLLLRLYLRLSGEKLRIHFIERLRFCLSGKCFDEWVIVQ
jgi:hypothetical protein